MAKPAPFVLFALILLISNMPLTSSGIITKNEGTSTFTPSAKENIIHPHTCCNSCETHERYASNPDVIPTDDSTLMAEIPRLQISPSSIIFGPDFSAGKLFNLSIVIEELDCTWNLTKFEFYVVFNSSIVEVVSIYEGSFKNPVWNKHGTFLQCYLTNTTAQESYLYVSGSLLSNSSGQWDSFPEGNVTLATMKFKALMQHPNITYDSEFMIKETALFDKNGLQIPCINAQNATYTMLPLELAQYSLDLYMYNPAYGGQGYNKPADLILPQTEITIIAEVINNSYPARYAKVTFEVRDNNDDLWAILQDDTDEEGHAYVTFRMPWPCEGAEELLGKWNITALVTLAEVKIADWMTYDYDYLIHIWKVTTDKPEYMHCESVRITVEYGTKAMREEDVILAVYITDELGVPIGVVLLELTVGGSEFCHYTNYTTTVTLHVDKFAYAGLATVHASFFNGLPSEGGEAVAQEVTTTFYILPC